ncbi:hypothetical protein Acor_04320 [Acrocarpospora corrugata]|uniref:SRPBCC domain-containing protein n=1 Tax=Acrocarpospora corrugata TaxID=35763 RepID=A0A5M3VUG1_9ACTN|nr:hypothetical protein [Acrocarpospora corrugata]GER98370.1 hypothetical protein Acor_04320 [Acrocarpospora corrugata]
MSEERFTVEVTISAPVDMVWQALRDPERIRNWHGWHFDGLDKEIEVIYSENVRESAAEYWLELQGSDRFELTDLGDSTRLTLTPFLAAPAKSGTAPPTSSASPSPNGATASSSPAETTTATPCSSSPPTASTTPPSPPWNPTGPASSAREIRSSG